MWLWVEWVQWSNWNESFQYELQGRNDSAGTRGWAWQSLIGYIIQTLESILFDSCSAFQWLQAVSIARLTSILFKVCRTKSWTCEWRAFMVSRMSMSLWLGESLALVRIWTFQLRDVEKANRAMKNSTHHSNNNRLIVLDSISPISVFDLFLDEGYRFQKLRNPPWWFPWFTLVKETAC